MSKEKGGFANMLHGLDDLSDLNLPAKPKPQGGDSEEAMNSAGSMLAIRRIKPDPNQPRRHFDKDKIRELADAIKQRGQLQPINVRPDPEKPGEYIINWGERRWLAMQELNLDQIRAEIKVHEDLLLAQLSENIDREDLSHMEIAYGIQELIKQGYKPNAIAGKMSRSEAWVSNYLQLPKMPDFLRESLEARTINDVFTAVEAFRLYKEHPDRVTETIVAATAESPVDRTTIRELKAKLKGEDNRAKGGKATTPPPADHGTESSGKPAAPPAPEKPAALSITVHVEDQDGVELGTLTLSPEAPADRAKVLGLDGKGEMELPWREVRIRKITYH